MPTKARFVIYYQFRLQNTGSSHDCSKKLPFLEFLNWREVPVQSWAYREAGRSNVYLRRRSFCPLTTSSRTSAAPAFAYSAEHCGCAYIVWHRPINTDNAILVKSCFLKETDKVSCLLKVARIQACWRFGSWLHCQPGQQSEQWQTRLGSARISRNSTWKNVKILYLKKKDNT